MKLTRPEPLRFERADGSVIIASPATRGQMESALALDVTVTDPAERRGKAVAILLQDSCTSEELASLTADEETDILFAYSAQHRGISAETAVEIQRILSTEKKKTMTS